MERDRELPRGDLLPAQLSRNTACAERNLWLKVLALAFLDLELGGRRAMASLGWINYPGDGVGTFAWVCAAIGFDAESVRARLLTLFG